MAKVISLVKAQACAWLVTAGLLLLLSFLMYQFEAVEEKMSLGVIAVYVIATFSGGFLVGHGQEKKRFLWGMLTGILYYLILLFAAVLSRGQVQDSTQNLLSVFFLCFGGGMLGGMFS